MNLNKRHQLAIVLSIGILSIGALHFFSFRPKSVRYTESYQNMENSKTKMLQLKMPKSPQEIVDLGDETEKVGAAYITSLQGLGLEMAPAFKIPTLETLERPPDVPEKEFADRKAQYLVQAREKLYEEQLDLVLEEIVALQQYDRRRGGTKAGDTDMSFFGETAWRMPVALPESARGARLRDILLNAMDTRAIIKNISDNEILMAQQRVAYEGLLFQLGIDMRIYRDVSPYSLASKGEFLPLIHKMTFAQLIEEGLGDDRKIGSIEVTRELIYDNIEIYLPVDPLVDKEGVEMEFNEMYFIYQSLRFVNTALEIAIRDNIAQIADIKIEDASYIKRFVSDKWLPPSDMRLFGLLPTPTPPPPNIYTLPPEESDRDVARAEDEPPGQRGSRPGPEDIGYCIPISFQFRASNRNGWEFIYDVYSQFKLCEIDSYDVAAAQGQASETADVWFDVKFLTVPFLFEFADEILTIEAEETPEG